VVAAVEKGLINAGRMAFYQALIEQQQELRVSHPDWKK